MTRTALSCLIAVSAAAVAGCGPVATQPVRARELPAVGESISFAVYTHCGVEQLVIGGRPWRAAPPLYRDGERSAPEGWDDPYQDGRLTVTSPSRLAFTAHGTTVAFRPDDVPAQLCK